MNDGSPRKRFGRVEALVLIPNLLAIGVFLFYLAAAGVDDEKVEPLIQADSETRIRISELEAALMSNPGDVMKAIELSRLYQDLGEFPWSYNALLNAEKRSGDDPGFKLKLALAYLEMGKNKDGLRVMEQAIKQCGLTPCTPPIRVKLDLFRRVARLFIERNIDARRDRVAADKAVNEVFKPVKAIPENMRPKAPAQAPLPEKS